MTNSGRKPFAANTARSVMSLSTAIAVEPLLVGLDGQGERG